MLTIIALAIPGPTELMLLFGIVFFLFGAKKLPEFAKGIGDAIREIQKSRDAITKSITEEDKK